LGHTVAVANANERPRQLPLVHRIMPAHADAK
jgi:hypothetical protein